MMTHEDKIGTVTGSKTHKTYSVYWNPEKSKYVYVGYAGTTRLSEAYNSKQAQRIAEAWAANH